MAKVRTVEPNNGKHIAVAGDINTIIVSKEDTGGTSRAFIEAKFLACRLAFLFFMAGPINLILSNSKVT